MTDFIDDKMQSNCIASKLALLVIWIEQFPFAVYIMGVCVCVCVWNTARETSERRVTTLVFFCILEHDFILKDYFIGSFRGK